jgi:Lipid A 3-O-deacylase (PagL)
MAPASQPDHRGIRLTILLILLTGSLTARTVSAQTVQPPDPFARGGWHLELAAQAMLEAWNYNGNHEEVYGVVPAVTYGLGKGVVLTAAWPCAYISQRGVDASQIGATIGMRGRILRWKAAALFWDWGVGVSKADTFVPPRGTRFNYIAQGGAGATVRVRPGYHAVVGVRWIHYSNNGLAGRDRNPDIEAIGAHAGILIAF